MSIIIQNISPEGAPLTGTNKYRVRINQTVICEFEHDRQVNGLAKCLRDAADAVELSRSATLIEMLLDTTQRCTIHETPGVSHEVKEVPSTGENDAIGTGAPTRH